MKDKKEAIIEKETKKIKIFLQKYQNLKYSPIQIPIFP